MADDRNNQEEQNDPAQKIGDELNKAYEKARENTDEPPNSTDGGPGPGHRQ
jgi:hypothetical protein